MTSIFPVAKKASVVSSRRPLLVQEAIQALNQIIALLHDSLPSEPRQIISGSIDLPSCIVFHFDLVQFNPFPVASLQPVLPGTSEASMVMMRNDVNVHGLIGPDARHKGNHLFTMDSLEFAHLRQ